MPNTNFRNSIDFKDQNFYVGIDVHKKSWSVTVRTSQIEVAHFTQPPVAEVLATHLKKKYPAAIFHSAYEAGFCGTKAHKQLCQLGIQCRLVKLQLFVIHGWWLLFKFLSRKLSVEPDNFCCFLKD